MFNGSDSSGGNVVLPLDFLNKQKEQRTHYLVWLWRKRTLVLSSVFILLIGAVAFWPSLFTALSPYDTNPRSMLKAPSAEFWFGTDTLGRDLYARVIYGARYSLLIGFGATAIGLGIGVLLGTLAALGGRLWDAVIMRVIDILLSFPNLLFSMLVIAFLGAGAVNLLLAIGIASIPGFARVVRSELLVIRHSLFVEAGIAMGLSRFALIRRHILPNALGSVLIFATISIGTAILSGSALSFLGMGPQAPTPEWGLLLAEGRSVLKRAWWLGVFPGLFLALTVIAATLFGRALRHKQEG